MEQLLRDEWVINWLTFIEACEIYDVGFYTNMTFKQAMSKSPNITTEFIDSNPDFGWDYDFVSENPNLTLDYVLLHYDLPWDWFKISKHKNVTFDMILEYNGCYWFVEAILQNPNVTLNIIQTHEYFTNLAWNEQVIRCVMQNQSITIDDVEVLMKHKNYKNNHDYYFYLCSNPNITCDFVIKNKHLLNIGELCKNQTFVKNLTVEQTKCVFDGLFENYGYFSNPFYLIENLYESMETIMNPMTDEISYNDYPIHSEITLIIPQCKRCFKAISKNKNLTIQTIKNNLHEGWNCQNLWNNPMDKSRNEYIDGNLAMFLLMIMHEQKSKIRHETRYEQVIADEYILKKITNCLFTPLE